jgi:hypothetical protein
MKAAPVISLVASLLMLAGHGQAQTVTEDQATIDVPTRAAPQVPREPDLRAPAPPPATTVETPAPARAQAPTITPTERNAATQNPGGTCREAQMTVIIGGQQQAAYGRACQTPDGNWQLAR